MDVRAVFDQLDAIVAGFGAIAVSPVSFGVTPTLVLQPPASRVTHQQHLEAVSEHIGVLRTDVSSFSRRIRFVTAKLDAIATQLFRQQCWRSLQCHPCPHCHLSFS